MVCHQRSKRWRSSPGRRGGSAPASPPRSTAAGYAVVGTARSVEPPASPDLLMVSGDIAQAETAERVVGQALDRFGRVDTLINNAGIYIGKPFTDCTFDDYVAITSVNLTGFFHMTQRAIGQMVAQGGGHVVNVSTSLVEHADTREPSALAALTKGGLEAVTRSSGHRIRRTGRPGQHGGAGHHRDTPSRPGFVPGAGEATSSGPGGPGQRRGRRGALPRTGHVRHRCDPPHRRRPGGRG